MVVVERYISNLMFSFSYRKLERTAALTVGFLADELKNKKEYCQFFPVGRRYLDITCSSGKKKNMRQV